MYYGVNNVAQKVGSFYYGVNNVAQKVAKAYIGVNGVAQLFYSGMASYGMFYSDGSMVFQLGNNVDSSKTLTANYKLEKSYNSSANIPWNSNIHNVKTVEFKDNISVTNLAYYFFNAQNLASVNYGNLNMNKITNMHLAYAKCSKLTTPPMCGNKVISMYQTYAYCYNLKGSPVCGDKVVSMFGTYMGCNNLTGNPACGNNVTDMYGAYSGCSNLTGSPVCGNNVTYMASAYSGCSKLTGNPVCGDNVTNMYGAYSGCSNLTGSPVCGNNVTNMYGAYYNCTNLSGGNIYMYSNKIYDATYCFYGKNNSRQYNIYAYQGTITWDVLYRNSTSSIVGANITWTNYANGGFYNTAYNIYVLPI